jgi:transcription initiation factor TFIIB
MRSQASGSTEVSPGNRSPFRPATDGRRPQAAQRGEERRCPNCTTTIEPTGRSEVVCPECDLVLADEPISTLPRPRYDDESKARTGSRVTVLYADRGLGVGIDEDVTTDGDGRPLSRTQRRVAREKPWTKHRTTAEVRLDYALGEIRRMGGALDVPTAERERAAQLYRKAHKAGIVVGRSVDGFAAVCLLVAIRQSSLSIPVSSRELTDVSRADPEQIRTARGALKLHMDVEIPPMDPHDLLPRAASELSAPWTVRQCARTLLDARCTDESREFRGVSPRTLAAAALHAAYEVVDCPERPTLSALSSVTGVAGSTISDRKGLLLQYREAWER